MWKTPTTWEKMHVSRSRRWQVFSTVPQFACLLSLYYIYGSSFSLNLRKLNCSLFICVFIMILMMRWCNVQLYQYMEHSECFFFHLTSFMIIKVLLFSRWASYLPSNLSWVGKKFHNIALIKSLVLPFHYKIRIHGLQQVTASIKRSDIWIPNTKMILGWSYLHTEDPYTLNHGLYIETVIRADKLYRPWNLI